MVDQQAINAHHFRFVNLDGTLLPLSQFAGQPILIVNTATECGFTNQFKELEELWLTYKELGLIVIATPCNDFGEQEPRSEAEIAKFCNLRYKITFPITQKVTILGPGSHPFYLWACGQVSKFGQPRWNFHKFLIGPDGEMRTWFSSFTSPTAMRVRWAIEKTLADMTDT